MTRLFKYELKRLLLNKFFLGLLIICGVYSHQTMWSEIILGIANTAPFSCWSYGMYLAKVLPVLLVALLFFISFLYSKQEKKVEALTKATPIDPFKFKLLRFGTIILAFVLISLVPIAYSLWFYKVYFNFSNFGSLILPTLITLLPAMLFIFGLGVLGGRYHQGIIFVLMIVVILISYTPLPYAMDLFGTNFFKNYPLSIDVLDPAFSMPTSIIIGKFAYALIGIAMTLIASISKTQHRK